MKVGFIGLGQMGSHMARNLVKAGFSLRVFDVVEAARRVLVDENVTVCSHAVEVTEGVDFLVSMLPAGAEVTSLYLQGRLFEKIDPDTVVLDCSTIEPTIARQVAQEAKKRHIAFLDAPVSGGVKGAQAATLTFMVGGEEVDLERARPVLRTMGQKIFHSGVAGTGQVTKICNNLLLGVQMAGTAEALALGVANGLDPAKLSQIMRASSAGNWVLEHYNPWPELMKQVPASHQYQGGFAVRLMVKDLGLAELIAEQACCDMPMGERALGLFKVHEKEGHGELDFSSIQKHFCFDQNIEVKKIS